MSDLLVTKVNKYNRRNFQALESSHEQTVALETKTILQGVRKYET